ncbi:MAG: hypothetical protein AAF430_11800 [Myxococcota bacterium]
MIDKKWIALLGIAAIAVGVQNYLFFTSGPDMGGVDDDEEEEDFIDFGEGEGESPAAAKPPPPVGNATAAAWMALQPGPMRSPFLTLGEAALRDAERPLEMRVGGVLFGPTRRVAWIDGRPHSEHDWVGEHRIERIGPESVWLRVGDELMEVAVSPAAPPTELEEEEENGDG